MAGMSDIINLVIAGGAVYLAYSTGLLDQAGQAIVTATTPKGGFAKERHHKRRKEVIVPYPIVEPILVGKPRMRLTLA